MFERFTDESRRVVIAAEEEARSRGFSSIGPSHLFIALLTKTGLGDTAAATGMPIGEIVSSLRVEGGSRGDQVDYSKPNEVSKEIFEAAGTKAEQAGHIAVLPQDLFLALLDRDDEPAVATVIRSTPDVAELRRLMVESIPESDGSTLDRCTRCGAGTQEHGQVRTITLPVEAGPDISVFAYFCGSCGATYGLVPASDEDDDG